MSDPVRLFPVEIVPIDSVRPHPDNYREWDVGAIAVSIERLGFYAPVVAQRSSRFIVAGSGRWTALRTLGHTEIPVHFMDWTDAEAHTALLADNWIPRRARDRDQELLDLMESLRHEDAGLFEATGVEDDDVEALTREIEEADKPLKLDSRKMVRKARTITCPECGAKFEAK